MLPIPPFLVRWAVVGLVAIACLGTAYFKGRSDQADSDETAAHAEEAKYLEHIQTRAIELNTLRNSNASKRWEISKRGDQIKTLQTQLVTAKSDAHCIIPLGFIKLYNSGYEEGSLLSAAGPGDDEAASGVALSAVAETDRVNRLAFEQMREQCSGLQRERQAIATEPAEGSKKEHSK